MIVTVIILKVLVNVFLKSTNVGIIVELSLKNAVFLKILEKRREFLVLSP